MDKLHLVRVSFLAIIILSSSACTEIANMQQQNKEQELLQAVENKAASYYCYSYKRYPENESQEQYQSRQDKIDATEQDLELAEIRAKQSGILEEAIQTSRDAGEAIGRRDAASKDYCPYYSN